MVRRRSNGERETENGQRLVLFFALVALGCATVRLEAPQPDRPFIVTFWCGPPLDELTDERAREIAAAGFNVIGPPCEGNRGPRRNLRALDVAARHGLRVWIGDGRFSELRALPAGWEERLEEAVALYREHPALGAYFVEDEPTVADLERVGVVIERLHRADPDGIAYVNLYPDYAAEQELGPASYETYLEKFLESGPRLLSYDYYPFGEKKDRSSFFENLHTIRNAALRRRIPFMLIVLAMPHGPYRDPTESELAWQIFHALAFGARGISYFAYWTPVQVAHADKWQFRRGLIENGKPTIHYAQAARLNREARAFARALGPFESIGIADSRGEVGAAFPIGPIESVEGGPITAGLFGNAAGDLAVLLVNRDYHQPVTARLQLRDSAQPPEVLDLETRSWSSLTDLSIPIPAGRGRLLVWRAGA